MDVVDIAGHIVEKHEMLIDWRRGLVVYLLEMERTIPD
jgi:hypothetical protein